MKALYNNSNRRPTVLYKNICCVNMLPQDMILVKDLGWPWDVEKQANESSYLEIVDVKKVDLTEEAREERIAAAKERARVRRNKRAKELRDERKLKGELI